SRGVLRWDNRGGSIFTVPCRTSEGNGQSILTGRRRTLLTPSHIGRRSRHRLRVGRSTQMNNFVRCTTRTHVIMARMEDLNLRGTNHYLLEFEPFYRWPEWVLDLLTDRPDYGVHH